VDRPLWPSTEASFTAATSAQVRCRSLTSEPVPSTTPPAYRRCCPSTHMRCRGRPIPGELLHPPLLSSFHHFHITLFHPSPFFLAQEHRKELGAATAPLLCPPRHPSLVRASLPAPFSIPRRWRLHPTSWVVSPPDRKHRRSSYARTANTAGEPVAISDAPSPHEIHAVVWVHGECAMRCSCSA
jgi:hypothetical protein